MFCPHFVTLIRYGSVLLLAFQTIKLTYFECVQKKKRSLKAVHILVVIYEIQNMTDMYKAFIGNICWFLRIFALSENDDAFR